MNSIRGFFRAISSKVLINRFTRDKSLRSKLIMYFLIFILLPLSIVSITSYYRTKLTIEHKTSQYVRQLLEQVDINLSYYLRNAVYISSLLSANKDLSGLVTEYDKEGEVERLKSGTEITRILGDLVYTRMEFFSITFFRNENIFSSYSFLGMDGITRQDYYDDLKTGKKNVFVIGNNPLEYDLTQGRVKKKFISVFSRVCDPGTGELLGIVMVNIDYKVISRVVESIDIGPESRLAILSEENEVIYENGKEIPVAELKKNLPATTDEGTLYLKDTGEEIIAIYKVSPYSGWKIIAVVRYQNLIKDAIDILYLIILIGAVCILMGIIVSIALASHISNPIKQLVLAMKKVEMGDLSSQLEVKSNDEVGMLAAGFNTMLVKLDELIKKIYEEQGKKRKAEVKALEMQINPHFIYNTLDSIKWVAILQKANNAAEMITYLVRLLQISLNKGKEYVTVREEVEHVRCYVRIQRFRYNDKFDIGFDIEEGLEEYFVPKLILQPIIENSIFHGFRKMVRGGKIQVICRREEKDLRFLIVDNGCGIENGDIKRATDSGGRIGKGDRFSGIGISNVNERIMLLCGERYGIKIENVDEGGVKADIFLPQIPKTTGEDA